MEELALSGIFGDRSQGGFHPGPGMWLVIGAALVVLMMLLAPPKGSAAGRTGFRMGWVFVIGAGVIILYLIYLQAGH